MHFLSFTLINNFKIMPLSSTFNSFCLEHVLFKVPCTYIFTIHWLSEKFNLQIQPFSLLYFVTAQPDISTKHVKSNINITALP
jgi:hypothetical protein